MPGSMPAAARVAEIGLAADEMNAATVIFNHTLSPGQQRNLEKELGRRVLDRTELILHIFAQRAQTNEGKLQVELAQLEHLSTRLVRGWTHLERQRGGLGKTGGPGEKQIELDRRYIARRVGGVEGKNWQNCKNKERSGGVPAPRRDVFSVALVGYTNAGKSTLFQRDHAPGRGRLRRGQAVRHARYHHAQGLDRKCGTGGGRRHGRLHPRPAARTGGRVPRHAGGDGAGRPAAARGGQLFARPCAGKRGT